MISKRIRKIAELINNDESVLDIGCDHGYLAFQLRKNGNKSHIICSDNKTGPLNNAKENLVYFDDIDFLLSDGALNVKDNVDVVVMSGMGYHTVTQIISQSKQYFDLVNKIIIQVNTDVDKMREWLVSNDYSITDEIVVFDIKYYQIMVINHGMMQLDKNQIKYGPCNLTKKDEVFKQFLLDKKSKYKIILDQFKQINEDYKRIQSEIDEIDELLKNLFNVAEI